MPTEPPPDWVIDDSNAGGGAPRPQLPAVPRAETLSPERVLDWLAHIERLIDQIEDVEPLVQLRDAADMARYLARKAELARDVQNRAAVARIIAERKLGLALLHLNKHPGGRPSEARGNEPLTYADLSITYADAHRWQTIARLPVEQFQAFLDERQLAGGEITSAAVYRYARAWLTKHADEAPPPARAWQACPTCEGRGGWWVIEHDTSEENSE